MTLTEAHAHIGDQVIYTTDDGRTERGVITDVSATFVRVRYAEEYIGKATSPEHLTLAPIA